MPINHPWKIHRTREPLVGFMKIGPSLWMFVDLKDHVEGKVPRTVGLGYASKAELLADFERYLTECGHSN